MSLVSRLNGFKAVKSLTGPFTGMANMYFIPASDATVLMVGDLVKLAGDARSPTGVPTVTRITAVTDPAVGVVVGFTYEGMGDVQNVPPVNDLNTPVYRRASTDRYVMVIDDPQVMFEVQTSVPVLTTDIGLNASPRLTAGSTASGASGMDVDMSTKATTATLALKLVGFPYRPDNNTTDAFTSVYVKINNHQYNSGTGTAGL